MLSAVNRSMNAMGHRGLEPTADFGMIQPPTEAFRCGLKFFDQKYSTLEPFAEVDRFDVDDDKKALLTP